MNDRTTGAMQQIGILDDPTAPDARADAGLLLLYASEHAELPGGWVFETPKAVIGRDANAGLFLPVQAVSRIHAEVTWDAGRWVIRDLESRNGILVDGHPVRSAVLESNAEVRIGDALLKYVDRDARLGSTYRIHGQMVADARRRVARTELVGGMQMDRIAAELERIAPTPLSVMLLGESGTGKEVAARELHQKSGRRGPFQAINCAAIPATLLESELFGYRKGAFSGADRDKPGIIRMADGGTLLLDEIGDMPIEAQAKLLRVLQSREVFPLGATAAEHVDVRIVCATHRDLSRLIQTGKFRDDLYARLNEYPLRLPPLRDRKEDLFLLSCAFLERYQRSKLTLSYGFMIGLLHYDWPYNVRELEACIKRCCALADTEIVTDTLLPEAVREAIQDYGRASTEVDAPSAHDSGPTPVGRPLLRSIPTDAELRSLLDKHRGNVAAVGRELGKARMQIHRWMERYGIEVDDYR
jgi:sigma-54 dependent transcriptional regulator, acetoin dehydrogenase operon transcriptional activator AcoR